MTVLRASRIEDGIYKNIFKCRSKEPNKTQTAVNEKYSFWLTNGFMCVKSKYTYFSLIKIRT